MRNKEEIKILIEILEKIPGLPPYFIQDMEEKMNTIDDFKYEQIKTLIIAAAERIHGLEKKYIENLNEIQRNKITPLFQNLESHNQKTENKDLENILAKINP